MGSNQHHHDATEPPEERLRQALHQLARSSAGAPPLSGAELRALAERRRGGWLVRVPSLACAGLLLGTAAFALTGGFTTGPRHTTPTHGKPHHASAPPVPGAPHHSRPPVAGPIPTAPGPAATAPPSGPPAATALSHAPRPPLPGPTQVAACLAAPAGETLISLHELSTPDTLTPQTSAGTATGTGATLAAVPLSCSRGHLVPSGPPQRLEVAPEATVTTTFPLSNGPARSPGTLTQLATELARHPDQLFGIRQEASGYVIRLDEVYVR